MKRSTKVSTLLLLCGTLLYSNSFSIKLASYSNKTRLLQEIEALSEGIGEGVIIQKEGSLYKAYSPPFKTKQEALAVLPLYRQLFGDAYITTHPIHHTTHTPPPTAHLVEENTTTNPAFESYQADIQPSTLPPSSLVITKPEENRTTPTLPQEQNSTQTPLPTVEKTVEENRTTPLEKITKHTGILIPTTTPTYQKSLSEVLHNRTFFLVPDTITSNSQKLLIEAKFDGSHVTYKSLQGAIPSLKMGYSVQQEKLYFLHNGRVNPQHFSRIEREYFEYYVISKWIANRRISQTRYYKIREAAQSYLDSINL